MKPELKMITEDGVKVFSKRTMQRIKEHIFDLEIISNSLYEVKCDIKICESMAKYLTNFRYLKYRANSELNINSPVKLCKEHYMLLIKSDQVDLMLASKKEKDVKKRLVIDIPFLDMDKHAVICMRCDYKWRPELFKQKRFLMPDSCPRCHSYTWWKINTVTKHNKERTKPFWAKKK